MTRRLKEIQKIRQQNKPKSPEKTHEEPSVPLLPEAPVPPVTEAPVPPVIDAPVPPATEAPIALPEKISKASRSSFCQIKKDLKKNKKLEESKG